jgi:putative hydrolase of the HAD superfamily
MLPKAFLLDLDDTIIDDSSAVDLCWREAAQAGADDSGISADRLLTAIRQSAHWFWSDPERHRIGRLSLLEARIEVVRLALTELGVENRELAKRIGRVYDARRDETAAMIPGALETVNWLRSQGCRLALITNGGSPGQRRKIEKFKLAPLFNEILIEGEVGFGKPDTRVFELALQKLSVRPAEAWMAGDNLEWDVAAPQRLGIFSIWIDSGNSGSSKLGKVRPDRIVQRLSDVRSMRSNGQADALVRDSTRD